MFQFKYKPLEAKNIIQVGRFFFKNLTNHKKRDPKFCVAMDLMQGWVATIGLLGLNKEDIKFAMDFEKYPIKCHFCGNIKHLLKYYQSFSNCKTLIKWFKGLYNQQQHNIKRKKHKGKGMGLMVEKNPQNQRARPLVNVKRFIEIVKRRNQYKAIEKPSRMDRPFQIKGI
jgi:hypothetical protein